MKVKIFSNVLFDELEKDVNEFLETVVNFKGIKFISDISKYSAMILYEDW